MKADTEKDPSCLWYDDPALDWVTNAPKDGEGVKCKKCLVKNTLSKPLHSRQNERNQWLTKVSKKKYPG